MKKTNLLFIALMLILTVSKAQTATNFTCNDCSGSSHTLFTELDAGTVIVIVWVMPCSSCITVSTTVANTVDSYSISHPGRVKFYLADDYANTSCSVLSTWAFDNGFIPTAVFSNSAINMTNYGATGMPKTVVLGGAAHSVFYNMSGNINLPNLTTAIDNALLATAISETNFGANVSVFPNPTSDKLIIDFSSLNSQKVSLQIMDMQGKQVKQVKDISSASNTTVDISDLTTGNYTLNIITNEGTIKRQISKK